MRTALLRLVVAMLAALSVSPAFAWNALGHKVVCEIAWQSLPPFRRDAIVAILRRHPRYDADFAKRITGDGDQDEQLFLHAGTWPDIARSIPQPDRLKFDHPTWHYVNFPFYFDGTDPPAFNKAVKVGDTPPAQWNVMQALEANLVAAYKPGADVSDRAVAYCWVAHLIADMHQPMHSTSVVCKRFPHGDRGGNEVPMVQGGNLHSLWDGLLGNSQSLPQIRKLADECVECAQASRRDYPNARFIDCARDSNSLAMECGYSPRIRAAIKSDGPLQPIRESEEYLKKAGEVARVQIGIAGHRLAFLLDRDDWPRTEADE